MKYDIVATIICIILSCAAITVGINGYIRHQNESRRAHFFSTQYSQRDPSGKLWFLIELDKSHKQFIISDDCIISLEKPLE